MNYKSFNLGDWIGHINGVIEDESELDGNEMRDLVEFLSMLEQEPCEDCISRQAVIGYIGRLFNQGTGKKKSLDFIKKYVEKLPSVNLQEPCSNCCNGNQIEKAKLCQKSYLAGMKHKQEPKWIPVSERLPEKDGEYLLWGKATKDEESYYLFIGDFDSGCEEFGIWEAQYDRSTLGCLDSEFFEYDKVIAWMPLQEPYVPEMNVGEMAESEDKK